MRASSSTFLRSNDAILLFAFLYSSSDVFVEWEAFDTCSKPVHLWLLGSYVALVAFRLSHYLGQYLSNVRCRCRRCDAGKGSCVTSVCEEADSLSGAVVLGHYRMGYIWRRNHPTRVKPHNLCAGWRGIHASPAAGASILG